MIEKLSGKYSEKNNNVIIIDVNGIGYGVTLTLSDVCNLPNLGDVISIWTYTYLKENIIKLYGFLNRDERIVFEVLLGVAGVGPKMAMAMLSTLKVETIKYAITRQQASIFEMVPGIGSRLAEKVLIELKPKLSKLNKLVSDNKNLNSVKYGISDLTQGMELNFEEIAEQKEHESDVLIDLRSALENLGFKEKAITSVILQITKNHSASGFQEMVKIALKLLVSGAA